MLKKLGIYSILVPLMFLVFVYEGAVAAKLWEWFVADLFDVNTISTSQAFGISCLTGIWCLPLRGKINSEDALYMFRNAILVPTITFVSGWIAITFF